MIEKERFTVSTWLSGAIGWPCAILCVFCAIMAGVEGVDKAGSILWGPVLVPFSIALYMAFPILHSGTIEATPEALGFSTLLGYFEMKWSDIQSIELGHRCIAFYGNEKRLSVPKPIFWSGPDKNALLSTIERIIREKQLKPQRSSRADYVFPKSTRSN